LPNYGSEEMYDPYQVRKAKEECAIRKKARRDAEVERSVTYTRSTNIVGSEFPLWKLGMGTLRPLALRSRLHYWLITKGFPRSHMTVSNETAWLVPYRGSISCNTVVKNRAWEFCS